MELCIDLDESDGFDIVIVNAQIIKHVKEYEKKIKNDIHSN